MDGGHAVRDVSRWSSNIQAAGGAGGVVHKAGYGTARHGDGPPAGTRGRGAHGAAGRPSPAHRWPAGLKSRAPDARDEEHQRLHAKVGELLMENELLYAKVDHLEAGGPLARRRSTR